MTLIPKPASENPDSPILKELALFGGQPSVPEGPPAWPASAPEIREAMLESWSSGDWGRYHGPKHEELRQQLADLHGIPHVWLCCSGTFAVELALRSLGLPEQSEVILAGYDFSGNFRAIETAGFRPVLADIDSTGWRLSPDVLEAAGSDQTRAIVVSHLHGGLADMPSIRELADRRGWQVVEDACQATAAQISGAPAGTWGDVGVLSFGGSKLLSAGRGGAILTRHPQILQRAKIFCERGNHAYPLSELQSAVLIPQVLGLAVKNLQRCRAADYLVDKLTNQPGIAPLSGNRSDVQVAYYKLGWHYDSALCGGYDRRTFINAIQAEGVAMDEGFRGFMQRGSRRCRASGALVNSAAAASSSLLLHHPVLLQDYPVLDRVAQAIGKVIDTLRRVPNA